MNLDKSLFGKNTLYLKILCLLNTSFQIAHRTKTATHWWLSCLDTCILTNRSLDLKISCLKFWHIAHKTKYHTLNNSSKSLQLMFISNVHGPWSLEENLLDLKDHYLPSLKHSHTTEVLLKTYAVSASRGPVCGWMHAVCLASLSPSCSWLQPGHVVRLRAPLASVRMAQAIRLNSVEFAQPRVPQRRCSTLKAGCKLNTGIFAQIWAINLFQRVEIDGSILRFSSYYGPVKLVQLLATVFRLNSVEFAQPRVPQWSWSTVSFVKFKLQTYSCSRWRSLANLV